MTSRMTLCHNLQHRIPVLWELHKVRHSTEIMIGATKDRAHPIDNVMNRVWDGLISGPVYGLWLFFAFDPAELTVLGINVYVLRNTIMMDFARHTHFKISFGPLVKQIILCPRHHQLHHSTNPKHLDKNFGLMLSIWDGMFGTLHVPEPNESVSFGLGSRARNTNPPSGFMFCRFGKSVGCCAWNAPGHRRTQRLRFSSAPPGLQAPLAKGTPSHDYANRDRHKPRPFGGGRPGLGRAVEPWQPERVPEPRLDHGLVWVAAGRRPIPTLRRSVLG